MKIWITRNGYKVIQVLAGRSNVFLVTDGNISILVDTSIRLAWNILHKRLRGLGINHIDFLALTHSHIDHAANAYFIKKYYGAKVVVHSKEAAFLETGNNHIPGGTGAFTRILMNLAAFAAPFLKNRPCKHDILFNERFDFKTGFHACIKHTPGHSPGSSSVIIDDEIALVGDCMIGSFKRTIVPPFADDIQETFSSWEKLLLTKCRIFIPSHGKEITRKRIEDTLSHRL